MNLQKIADALGTAQFALSVIDQMPPETQRLILATFACNGLDVARMKKQIVRAKHLVQAQPVHSFNAMLAVSADHLEGSVQAAISQSSDAVWGVTCRATTPELIIEISAVEPDGNAPASLRALCSWASDMEARWLLLGPSRPTIEGLAVYQSADAQGVELEALAA